MGMMGMGKNSVRIMGSLILVAAWAAATNTWAQTPTPAPGSSRRHLRRKGKSRRTKSNR